jgi:hypothetical protein
MAMEITKHTNDRKVVNVSLGTKDNSSNQSNTSGSKTTENLSSKFTKELDKQQKG